MKIKAFTFEEVVEYLGQSDVIKSIAFAKLIQRTDNKYDVYFNISNYVDGDLIYVDDDTNLRLCKLKTQLSNKFTEEQYKILFNIIQKQKTILGNYKKIGNLIIENNQVTKKISSVESFIKDPIDIKKEMVIDEIFAHYSFINHLLKSIQLK